MTVPTVERQVCLRKSVQLWHIQSLRGLVQQSRLGMLIFCHLNKVKGIRMR